MSWLSIEKPLSKKNLNNVKIYESLIKFFLSKNIKNFIYFGSIKEYGNLSGKISENTNPKPNTWYGKSKLKIGIKGQELAKKYREENPEKHRKWFRKWNQKYQPYKNNIQHKLRQRIRNRLQQALKGYVKNGSAVHDLGCTIEELKIHLENQFKEGMTWENWKPDGWHIDHKKPLSKFDLTDPEQLKEAVHYTNLQPLWGWQNISKGAKINWSVNSND